MTHPIRRDRGSVSLALAAYRSLLRLYPAAFRQRFGGEMVQVFRDSCHAAQQAQGSWGVLRYWVATLPDIIITAIREQQRALSQYVKEFQMQASTLIRLGGIMAFVAVFFQSIVQIILVHWDAGHKLAPRHAAEYASEIAFFFVLLGLAAVQRSQSGRWLWGGIVAFGLVSAIIIHPLPGIPGVLTVFEEQGSATPLLWSTAYELVIFIAMAVASIITLRSRSLGRWSVAPLLMSAWVALSVGAWMLATNIINLQFQGDPIRVGEGHELLLRDLLVVIPGWLCLMGTGIGLLRTNSIAVPTYEIAESAQGK